MKLYDYFRSSASYRVRIALAYKSLDYEQIPIDLREMPGMQFSETYQAINPQSLVPTLVDGNAILTQSLSIIEYLDEAYPSTPPLLPSRLLDRAFVRSIALSIACDIHPLNNLRVLQYLKRVFDCTEEAKLAWIGHWIALGFSSIESRLNADKGPYVLGDSPTIADICLIPQVFNARRFNCDLSLYPRILAIEENCLKLEAFQKAAP